MLPLRHCKQAQWTSPCAWWRGCTTSCSSQWWWRWRGCCGANCRSSCWAGEDYWCILLYTESLSNIFVAQWVDIDTLANDISKLNFWHYLQSFLHKQLKLDPFSTSPSFHPPDKLYVYSSAITTFYTPSDICGTGGMRCEHMHTVTSWRNGPPWYDSIFVNTNESEPGMCGLSVAWARLFFSITVNWVKYHCALVHWYSLVNSPDECTGMWVVEPSILDDGLPQTAVMHLDTVVHPVHLLPIYGEEQAPRGVKYTGSLDTFSEFYINKYADHRAFEIAF